MRKIPQHHRENELSKMLSGTDYTFVRWTDGFKNNKSSVTLNCPTHGDWSTSFINIVAGRRCGKCAIESQRMTVSEVNKRISDSLPANQTLLSPVSEYTGNYSKFNIMCGTHGVWSASALHLIHSGSGCPSCAKVTTANKRRTPVDIVVNRMTEILSSRDYSFTGFAGRYENNKSKVNVTCNVHGVWSTDIATVLANRVGCPSCSKNGFDPSKPATLYVLRSDCGRYFKVGITNKLRRRIVELRRVTPFEFAVVHTINAGGSTISILEKSFHASFDRATLHTFHGHTEWFNWDDTVLCWIRLL